MNWDKIKSWTWVGAISVGLGVVITKFFDVLSALLGPETALHIVHIIVKIIIILGVAIGSIIVSWVVTEIFKRAKYPEPKGVKTKLPDGTEVVLQPAWKDVKGRLWMCGITWNIVVNGGFLMVLYLPLELTRHMLVVLGGILIWSVVVGGAGIAAYDIFVHKLYHKVMRILFPTKYVRIVQPDGSVTFEERPADVPSDPDNEKTVVIDRTKPPAQE